MDRKSDPASLLTAKDIQERLSISRKKTYELLNRDDFPSIRVGERSIRVPQEAFRNWIDRKLQNNSSDSSSEEPQ